MMRATSKKAVCTIFEVFGMTAGDGTHNLSDTNITKTRLFKYFENFTTKIGKFQIKNSDIFHISAQNIDCGYLLELSQ